MQSLDIAKTFALQAGLSAIAAQTMPSWYFQEGSNASKGFAIKMGQVWHEAQELHSNYSDSLAAQAAQQFPALYAHVMHGQRPGISFVVALGQQYRQLTPILNLASFIHQIEKKFHHHLVWAADHERYELIIAGIRADQMLEAMDLEKKMRYATGFQNRILGNAWTGHGRSAGGNNH